jgi:hypothetical protein
MAQGGGRKVQPGARATPGFRDLPHASASALDRLEDLLIALRAVKGIRETSRGRFYRRGRTFLHFHEQGDDLFADVRWTGAGWTFERAQVTTPAERSALLDRIRENLARPAESGRVTSPRDAARLR